jgi:hypothetical protein
MKSKRVFSGAFAPAAFLLFAATAVLAGSENANAVTIHGSYTVSYTPIAGNSPTFTYSGALSHTSFTINPTLNGAATAQQNFFVINPTSSCGSNCIKGPNEGTTSHPKYYYTQEGTVSVTFSFSGLTVLSGSYLTETGLYQAKYGGAALSPCALPSGSGDTDCITWKTTAQGGHDPLIVNFSNGTTLAISLYDAEDWAITPKVSFKLYTTPVNAPPPAVPVPGAIWLFGSVLAGGTGFGHWRNKRKRAA